MRWQARSVWAAIAALVACGGESISKNEDGDTAGDAGESSGPTSGTSTGGAERGGSSGANTGALGGTATGGTAGTAPGGTTAAGGSATGGNTTGGVAGTAGSTVRSACGTTADSIEWMTFDTDTEGFIVKASASDVVSEPVEPSSIMLGWTDTDGMPALGALEVSIPYSMPSQWVALGVSLSAPVDLTGRVISLCMKFVSGLGDPVELMTAPGGTKIYAKSGVGYCYANGSYQNVGDMAHRVGQWMVISFNLLRVPDYEDPNCVTRFDPSDIREIGVQFDTSSMTTTARPALFRIDTVSY